MRAKKPNSNQIREYIVPMPRGEWKIIVRSAHYKSLPNLEVVRPNAKREVLDWKDPNDIDRVNRYIDVSGHRLRKMGTGMPEVRMVRDISEKCSLAPPEKGLEVAPIRSQMLTHKVVRVSEKTVYMTKLEQAVKVKEYAYKRQGQPVTETPASLFWIMWWVPA